MDKTIVTKGRAEIIHDKTYPYKGEVRLCRKVIGTCYTSGFRHILIDEHGGVYDFESYDAMAKNVDLWPSIE